MAASLVLQVVDDPVVVTPGAVSGVAGRMAGQSVVWAADAALRGHGVAAGREDLGDAGGGEALFGHAERGAQTGAASADDDHVELVVDDFISGPER